MMFYSSQDPFPQRKSICNGPFPVLLRSLVVGGYALSALGGSISLEIDVDNDFFHLGNLFYMINSRSWDIVFSGAIDILCLPIFDS